MMRPVKNYNESLDLSYLDCGHAVRGIRGIEVLTWCAACDQMKDTVVEATQYNPQYQDPLWNEKSAPIDSFQKLLHDMQVIHDKKRHDYSRVGNRYSNFVESGFIAALFEDSTDKAFAVLVGAKLSRLGNLLTNKLVPNNESIDDTFLDLTTYCALWAAYHKDNK